MKNKIKILLLSSFFIFFHFHPASATNYIHDVDPLIGSGGHGHVFVGASVPFGAVQVGPSNLSRGWDWCSGYNYRDSIIIGFPQLHLSGTGIGDLGDILIMPYMGAIKLEKGKENERFSGYSSHFSHQNETVSPGYYAVKLDDHQIQVELSASERVGFHQYHFPKGNNARIIVDLKDGIQDKPTDTYMEQCDKHTYIGYRASTGWAKIQKVYFAIKTNVPVQHFSLYEDTVQLEGTRQYGKAIKGLFSFEQSPEKVILKVGISPVSTENALANIDAEIPHWDLSKVRQEAEKKWEKELSKIEIQTNDSSMRKIFYTAFYHSMIHPSLFNDHNGEYRGADWQVHHSSVDNYTIFSLWDTYRAAHPLFNIVNTQKSSDFVNSMLRIYDQTGQLPIWHLRGYDTGTMVGVSSFQIISEAYLKGIKGFEPEKAYQAMKNMATSDTLYFNYHKNFQPIPSNIAKYHRPVARALEYSIGDASIAMVAKQMNKEEDYQYFSRRARNYKLYYDETVGFMRGKLPDGEWRTPFDPIKSKGAWSADYAEGNAWQYLWLVPHDVEGLIKLLGNEKDFIKKLDTFFQLDLTNSEDILVDLTGLIGQYAHGNEPSHHVAYLYAYVEQQWKTAEKIRYILKEFYHDQPDGLIGNEDCGQMSAWYILSSMGFYPVFPASCNYVIGSPLFDKATIHLENGKDFTIEAINNSPENIYIQNITLNGKKYEKTYINHYDIMQGGKLTFTMGNLPNKKLGTATECRPPSEFSESKL